MPLYCGIFLLTPGSVFTALTLGLVFCGASAGAGVASGLRVDFPLTGLVGPACFLPVLCAVAAVFGLALLVGEAPVLPPGTRPGTAAVPRGGAAAALGGAGPLALAVTSLLFGKEQAGLGSTGEAVRELAVGFRLWGAAVATRGVVVTAVFETVRALRAASRRRREAGEPGRRCARRERWLAPVGGRPSFAAGALAGAVMGRGTEEAVGEVQGLEGLGHLEDGSGQTGLLG